MSGRSILFLCFLLPSIPASFFRPFYGILAWTIISFANPQSYAWGAAYDYQPGVLIAIPTLAGFLVFGRGTVNRIMEREVLLLLILWGWFFITSAISVNTPLFEPHAEATWKQFQFVTKIYLITIVTIGLVNSFERLRTLVIVTTCCFGFYVVKSVPFMILTGGTFRIYGAEHSMLEDNNDFGLALNMALPMMFFLAQTETNKWSKRFFWFLFLSTIPAIFFTYSRGALLGLMAIMGLMLLQSKQRLVLVPVLAAALMVAVLFTPDAWRQRMSFASGEGTAMDQSAYSRINAWTFAWRLVGDYPVTGGGFKTFTVDLFKRYAPNANDVHGPHSVYFGVLGEHGWVGLFLYMTLVGSCFLTVRRVIKWAKQCGDEVSANYARMFQFSLIGFLVSGLFLGRAYFDFYYSIVACLVILKHLTRLKWREARSAALNAEAQVVAPVSVAEGSVAY